MRTIFRDPAYEEAFRKYGYVIVPWLSEQEVAALWKFFETRIYSAPSGFYASMYTRDFPYRQEVYEHLKPLMEPKLDQYVIDYRVCCSNFMVKPAHDSGGLLPMHVDWSFVDEPEQVAVHMWVPLLDVNPENGCLAIVPGTHHLADPERAHADDIPFREVMPLLEKEYLLELTMKAGSCVLYDGRLVHGSRVNRSDRPRVATNCICVPREAPVHHMVRVNPQQVEKFLVDDRFFWTYELFSRPQAKSTGLVNYEVKQLTEAQVRNCPYVTPVETALPLAATS